MERTKSLGTLDNMDIPNPIMKEEKRDMSVGTQTMELSPKDYLKTLLGLSVEDILQNPTMSITPAESIKRLNNITPTKTPSLQQKMRMMDNGSSTNK